MTALPTAGKLLAALEPSPAPPSTDKPLKLGTVDPAFASGLPKVTFDGETAMSTKTYAYVGSRPAAGARVALAPVGTGFVILGAVGTVSAANAGYFESLVVNTTYAGSGSITVSRVGSAPGLNVQQVGDSVARVIVASDASLRFGSGSAAVDARLTRTATGFLTASVGSLFGGRFVRKTADESVTNSAALQNDDHLVLAVDANATYLFDLGLWISSTSEAPEFKWTFTFPSGATLDMSQDAAGNTLTGGSQGDGEWTGVTGVTSGTTTVNIGTRNGQVGARIWGILITSSTAGNLQLQWAQNTATAAVSVTLKSRSWMRLERVE